MLLLNKQILSLRYKNEYFLLSFFFHFRPTMVSSFFSALLFCFKHLHGALLLAGSIFFPVIFTFTPFDYFFDIVVYTILLVIYCPEIYLSTQLHSLEASSDLNLFQIVIICFKFTFSLSHHSAYSSFKFLTTYSMFSMIWLSG